MVRIRAVHAAALCLAILSSSTVSAFVPSRLSMPHLRLSKSARNRAGPALLPRMCVRGEGNESRRAILLRCSATVAASLGAGLLGPRQSSADEAPVELKADKAYNGPSAYGFKFKYPKSWKPNKQVGNTHLYNLQVTSGKEGGGGRIALTVDQIKANSLKDWSSLEAACERLKANLGKSSKNGGATSVVQSREFSKGGMTYYEIAVKNESGAQEWSKLAVTAQQLFALTLSIPKAGNDVFAAEVIDSFTVKFNSLENFQQTAKGQAPEVLDYIKQVPSDIGRVEAGEF